MQGFRKVLLLGGDCISRLCASDDMANQMLFGDAGFAAVLDFTEKEVPSHYLLGTDGHGADVIRALGASPYPLEGKERTLKMDGLEVANFTMDVIPTEIKAFLLKNEASIEDYAGVCFHQANLFILKQIALLSAIPKTKVFISIDQYGNTSSASIPLTLCAMGDRAKGRILMAGFGVGLSWGLWDTDLSQTMFYPVIKVEDVKNV
ncbi:MAG: 3-oxoacyl-[acyl-carrier-protein] synthase III C-terminal domain-containing protein [Kiritimatiellia bacterium]